MMNSYRSNLKLYQLKYIWILFCFLFVMFTQVQSQIDDSLNSVNSSNSSVSANTTINTGNSTTPPIYIGDSTQQNQQVQAQPSEIQLIEIDGDGKFSREDVNAGDTVSYIITIEWKNPKVPVSVLAPESLSFSGLKKIKASTSHKKMAELIGGQPVIKNKSVFLYLLQAEVPGSGKASSTRLPYFSAMSQDKEYVTISPQLINVLPAKIPLSEKWYIKILFWILIASGLISGALFTRKRFLNNKTVETVDNRNIDEKLKELKSRLNIAAPQEFILQMQALALDYLRNVTKRPLDQNLKLDGLLKIYREEFGDKNKEDWDKLKQDFELANFGGGNKASHELAESLKILTKCIQ